MEELKTLDPQKLIFLIDGSSLLYRGYYGMRPLHTSSGIPVQAVYTFCRMIRKLIDQFDPHYMAIVWDSKEKTARHEIYEEYKATREVPPSDLFEQKDKIVKFAELIGLFQVQKPGVEADDLMFSVAQEQIHNGNTVVLVTSDKDMGQALSDYLFIYDSFKDELINKQRFEKKMRFPVQKLPFYYALVGDVSDNIPGVAGIGKKIATELVQQFDSLEDIYNRLSQVGQTRARTALQMYKKEAFLSYKLFLLQYIKTDFTKAALSFNAQNWSGALPFFEELEFKSLLKQAGKTPAQIEATIEEKIEHIQKRCNLMVVKTRAELERVAEELRAHKIFALDTETDGVLPLQTTLVGISVCYKEGIAYYIPCNHNDVEQVGVGDIIDLLKPIFESEEYHKYLHNAKYDQLVLAHQGIELRGIVFDSVIAANLITQDWQSIGLKALSSFYFNEPMLTYAEVVKKNKYKNFSYVPLSLAIYYAAYDAHQTFKLARFLKDKIQKENFEKLYYEIELPLSQVLYEMEKTGIYVDVTLLQTLNKQVEKALTVIESDIQALIPSAHKDINLNSPKQVEQLLFYSLQLPPQKKSAKGSFSTDQEVLVQLAKLHPVPALIVKYRELFKLKSTYIDALPTYVNPETKRVHTTFSQTQVATGRLSSSDPNLQNIPADASGFGIQIRAAFKPEPGHILISADYSQIELRVLAYFSRDYNLTQAFLEGHDIHAQTAARLFDVDLDRVTYEQRQIGKRINFSILYGLTPYGLSKDLDISFTDAKKYIEKYFKQYPHVLLWMEEVVAFAKEHGYVTTYWGRRRYIPSIYEKNKVLYEEARRIAINTVAQGTAAEIMKEGMLRLDKMFKNQNFDAKMLLQIHDELLITVAQEQIANVESMIKKELEAVVSWNIPLIVTTRSGSDWKEITK